MLFWIVRLRSGLSGCSCRRRGFDQASSCAPVASRAMKNAWEANMNRPHLATSLRCTMYDSMWQLCTEAMVTLAFYCRCQSSYACGALRRLVAWLRLFLYSSLRADASECYARCQFCHLWKRAV